LPIITQDFYGTVRIFQAFALNANKLRNVRNLCARQFISEFNTGRFVHKVCILNQLAKLFVFAFVITLAVPVTARNRAGDKLLRQAEDAEAARDFEKALDLYEKAVAKDPKEPAYTLGMRRTRFQAASARIDMGVKLRNAGKLEEALASFVKAFAMDPSLTLAEIEIKRTKDMIEREKNGGKAPSTPEERGMTPAQRMNKQSEEKSAAMMAPPELKPIMTQITTLKMTNQPVRVLYETVGKWAGINVVFDPEFQPASAGGKSTFSIDLSNTNVEEALDYLSLQTKTFWKPLSANTIFVTNESVQKRRDFDDYVVKVLYIKNATTVQELQEISSTIRAVTEIRRAFTYNAQNAILVRGTTDQVALAEKLVMDLDKPKSEVVVDITVMEVNRDRIRDLSATFLTSGAAGLKIPVNYGAATSSTTTNADGSTTTTQSGGALSLLKFGKLSIHDFTAEVPTALFQAVMSDSQTRVVQQPQVRAVEGNKASLRIGDKVPYATGSYGSGIGSTGAGVSPLVQTQFSFAEVGVNVDLLPHIHGRDEVSMHIEIEISNVSGNVTIGGIKQPIISQRKVAHDIRIREGEVSVLGGLIDNTNTRTSAGVPGLMDVPVFGKLFSTENTERKRGELLIALTPHIIRYPDYTEANLRTVNTGSDQVLKLNYSPRPAAAPAPAAPAPAPATPPAATPATPPTPGAAAPAGPAQLVFNPAAAQTQLSSVVTVALQLNNATDVFTAPMKLKWDPKILRLSSIQQGNLLGGDGQKVNFSENTLNDSGDASITLNRMPGTGGISGSGTLVTLTFQAVGKGTSQVSVTDISLKNSQLQPITAAPPSLSVVVQ
jgi:general secretion pathway protein D